MELILWRHAEAQDGFPDLERRLTPKGEKQARRIGQWLNDRLPDSARILTSPAARAQQTAEALHCLADRKLKVVPQIGPGAEPEEFLEAVGWPGARSTVVAVGHQPTLGLVASLLLSGHAELWSVKKGAVWWLSSRPEEGDRGAALLAMVHPGLL